MDQSFDRILRGKRRRACHFGAAVEPVDRLSDEAMLAREPIAAPIRQDVRGGVDDFLSDAHRAPPSSVDSSERTSAIVRFASSTLNALSLRGIAGSSSAAAAFAKFSACRSAAPQGLLRDRGAPRFVRHAAKREANVANDSVLDRERGSHRDQSKRVTRAVPHLAIGGMKSRRRRREINRGDQFARQEIRIDFGSISWKAVEIGERDAALSGRAKDVHTRIECGERHAHIRRVRSDAPR